MRTIKFCFLGVVFLSTVQAQFSFAADKTLTETNTAIKLKMANKKSAHSEPSFHIKPWEKRLNKRQPPLKIIDAIGAVPGMVIGEVGAGSGRMTMWLAERVGSSGKVYANDIDKRSLENLRKRSKRDGFKNIEIIVGETKDPKLPTGMLDIAFMINVYHHLDNPVPLIRNTLPSLKSGGVLAIVECDPTKVDWGVEEGCKSKADVTKKLKETGFEIVRIETFLDEDNIYIAKPAGKNKTK